MSNRQASSEEQAANDRGAANSRNGQRPRLEGLMHDKEH